MKKVGKPKKHHEGEHESNFVEVKKASFQPKKKMGSEIDEIFGARKRKMGSEIDEIFGAKKRKMGSEIFGASKHKIAEKEKKGEDKKPSKDNVRPLDKKKRKSFSFKENCTSRQRKKTGDGLTIFTEEELGIAKPDAGGTALCPFDCDCCF